VQIGSLAECCSAAATLFAVLIALFLPVLAEPLKRWFQGHHAPEVVRCSQIRQQHQQEDRLKTRLKVVNNALFADSFKVTVVDIPGRSDFISLPLVWLHGATKGEEPTTTKQIGRGQGEWVDLLTLQRGYHGEHGVFCRLDVCTIFGAGAKNLELLDQGKTKIMLRIDSLYGRPAQYEVTVDWDGDWRHPEVSYRKTPS
jgi:hypothetical protein